MKIPFTTTRLACIGIRDAFYTEKDGMYLRVLPYDIHDYLKASNWWWLSPSNEIPAHRHGKFLFCEDDDSRICIGLAMEKGLDKGFVVDPRYKKSAMDESWQWHRFFADLATGEFERALHLVASRSKAKPIIKIDWCYGPFESDTAGNAMYEWSTEDGLTCTGSSDPVFRGCKDLATLKNALVKRLEPLDSWSDFRTMLPFDPKPESGKGCWTLMEIKERLLEPFERWVV